MNRHHPYASGYDQGPRRGASGPGPERYNRFNDRGTPRRGRGRGVGGYSGPNGGGSASYDAYNTYEQGPPPPPVHSEIASYPYEAPTQDPYYQQSSYSSGQYPSPSAPSTYGYSGYGNKYEDAPSGPSPSYEDYSRRTVGGGNYGVSHSNGPMISPKVDRELKVQNSIIEERIQRERPCRTLFIRNIKYETNSADVRRQFEEYGDIKTFFDLISTRGMVFVTYFDLRAAERARERLQGSEISGRPIDVHYSLPRDDKGGDTEKNIQLQGTLQVTLRGSPSGQPIDDGEVRRKFQQFGDVKSVRPVDNRIDSQYVEFYDTRACQEAFDRLRHQGLQDGVMDIVFAWDVDEPTGPTPRDSGGRDQWDDGHRGRGGPRGRGNNNRGRGRGRGGGHSVSNGYDDDFDRRDNHGRDRRGGRFDDDYSRGGGRAPNDRSEGRPLNSSGSWNGGYPSSNPSLAPTPSAYNQPPAPTYNQPPPSTYNQPPPAPYSQPPPSTYTQPPPAYNQPRANSTPVPAPDERLEQARQVQALLAALKQPQPSAQTVPPAPAPAPSGLSNVAPPSLPPFAPGGISAYPLAPGMSTANMYGGVPPASAPVNSSAVPPINFAASPNLMTLLNSAVNPANSLATGAPSPHPAAPSGGGYQELLTFLQSNKQ